MEDSECKSDVNTNQLDLKTDYTSTDTKNECTNISAVTIFASETDATVQETKENNMMDDDDGEDLPDNFFDDFSNTDFMAGLDIVDDWVDDEEDPEKKREKGNNSSQNDCVLKSTSSDQKQNDTKSCKKESSPQFKSRCNDRDQSRREGRYSREDDRMRRNFKRSYEKSRDKDERKCTKEREFERRRSRSRDRYRDEHKSRDQLKIRDHERDHNKLASDVSSSKNNSKEKPIEEINDSRRDPEKTKRDIQRDKLRCAKDFEARVFQEQIKVAESGLVPPGTELDVVLEHEKRKQQEEQAILERPLERKKEEAVVQPVEKRRSVDRFHGKDKAYSSNHGRYSREHFIREQRSRERRSRERRSRERRSREKRSRERRSRERRSRERHIHERYSRDRHNNERRSRERHTNERRSRERHTNERRSRERYTNERRSRDRYNIERRSRDRYSIERALRNRKYSPEIRIRKREFDGVKRSRDRSNSPYYHRRSRSLTREELLRRNDDLRLRIREKRRERLMNELSPVSEARFSRSPSLSNMSLISNISEREFWLRNRDKYKSRYVRSCSPISSSSLSDLGSPRRKRSRKASFMEEIEKKLREKAKVHANTTNYGSPVFNLSEPPQPVPPPQQFQQVLHTNIGFQSQNPQMFSHGIVQNPFSQPQVIEHGMMIHQSMPGMPMMNMNSPAPICTMAGPTSLTSTLVEQSMMMPQVLQVQQQSALDSPLKIDSSVHRTTSNLKPCVSDADKEVTKLFEEQKISLSDYLSVSANPIDPKLPINVHKKIKVISKCQDVIRILKDDSKLCGRFFPKPAPPTTEKQEEKSVKWKSPLRKTFPVRFMFTTPCKKTPTHQEFVRHIINKLLFVCGIPIAPEAPNIKSASIKSMNTCTNSSISNIPSMSTSNQIPVQHIPTSPLFQKPVPIKCNSVGLQTDPVKCQICEIRSARTFSDESCQTIEKEMVDQSTQVTNEDLQKSMVTFTPRGILKNSGSNLQSLSHLTSAQLLSLQKEKTDDRTTSSRNESFMSRSQQEQFNSPANYMGRNQNNPPPLMSSSFNSSLIMNRSSNNFNSSFSGSMDKLPYNISSRSYGNAPHGNQTSSMNPGKSMNDFQAMGNRNTDRPNTYDRYNNEGYSSDDCFNDYNRNMGGNVSGNLGNNMGSPVSKRGRGGVSNRGYYMGNYGGQNRQFYN